MFFLSMEKGPPEELRILLVILSPNGELPLRIGDFNGPRAASIAIIYSGNKQRLKVQNTWNISQRTERSPWPFGFFLAKYISPKLHLERTHI